MLIFRNPRFSSLLFFDLFGSVASLWRRPSRALGSRVREQGFRRGVRFEISPLADDPRGEATSGSAVGTASLKGQEATTAAASNSLTI
jgi:hypothetical protein